MPDILLADQCVKLADGPNNWITLVYRWMVKLDLETMEGERTLTSTRLYHRWLDTYETHDGIPPHICFGGCIETGPSDPTFFSRWQEYALKTFC